MGYTGKYPHRTTAAGSVSMVDQTGKEDTALEKANHHRSRKFGVLCKLFKDVCEMDALDGGGWTPTTDDYPIFWPGCIGGYIVRVACPIGYGIVRTETRVIIFKEDEGEAGEESAKEYARRL